MISPRAVSSTSPPMRRSSARSTTTSCTRLKRTRTLSTRHTAITRSVTAPDSPTTTSPKREDIQNKRKHILQISENKYAYQQYFLPINHFEDSVFYYKNGIDELNNKKYFENKAIIDVGAFIGDSACVLSQYTKDKIYSFEAVQEHFDYMQQTIKMNNLKNVVTEKYALGEKEGEVNIRVMSSGSSIDPVMVKEPTKIETCKVITLDEYVREKNINVGLIKVDVEGAEQMFLKGAINTIKQYKPAMLISIYHNINDFSFRNKIQDEMASIKVKNDCKDLLSFLVEAVIKILADDEYIEDVTIIKQDCMTLVNFLFSFLNDECFERFKEKIATVKIGLCNKTHTFLYYDDNLDTIVKKKFDFKRGLTIVFPEKFDMFYFKTKLLKILLIFQIAHFLKIVCKVLQ